MKYYLLIICLLGTQFLFSQCTSTLDSKSQKKYNKAYQNLKKKNEVKDLDKVLEIMDVYPDYMDGHKDLAMYYLSQKESEKAYPHLKILAAQSSKLNARIGGELLDIYEKRSDWDEAIATAEKILSDNKLREDSQLRLKHRVETFHFRKEAYNNPVEFNPVKLDSTINTMDSEYLPAFNADGSMVIYTTRNTEGNNIQEDLFYAYRSEEGGFSQGEAITGLQTPENEGAHTFSQDGTILIFTACDQRDSRGGCDLYITFLKEEGWSTPRNLGPTINSRWWDSQPCLSADNKTLYFTSKRPGGYGDNDIWVSKLKKQGGWGEPINLGPVINTAGNEQSPFFHPDNTTLYFESDGHIGMGGGDLFMTRKQENDTWATPTNLGYPINNEFHQGALFVELNGNKAYYASEDTSAQIMHLDIYSFDLPENLRPLPSTYFKINVIDAVSKKPITAILELRNLEKGNTKVQRTDTKGSAISTITPGNYSVTINRKGYVFHSENINIANDGTSIEPQTFNIELMPLSEDKLSLAADPVILENIFFASGSATLLEISNYEIDKLYQLLTTNENIKIKITGHTDNVGQERDNQVLSENRAKAVYNVLVEKGIAANRISYVGEGESQPIADNTTEDGKRTNRRTEFQIIE